MATTNILKGRLNMANKKKDKSVSIQLKKAVKDAKKAGVKLVKVEVR